MVNYTKCPGCSYDRTSDDLGADYECPKCGIVYDKFRVKENDAASEPETGSISDISRKEQTRGQWVKWLFTVLVFSGVLIYFMNNKSETFEEPGSVDMPSDNTIQVSDVVEVDEAQDESEEQVSEDPEAVEEKNTPYGKNLVNARAGFETRLVKTVKMNRAPAKPPGQMFKLVRYDSPVGELSAYIGLPKKTGEEYPAIIWLTGGFSNSIGATAWRPAGRENDQSARAFREKGIIMMYPSLRGGNNNAGSVEALYGEVDDVIAAYDYLQDVDYVDSGRIYLGGHSTGGTLALLVAESTNRFNGIFSLGPVGDIRRYGKKAFNFDTSNDKEWELRSPIYYLSTISTPTFIFEGTDGNSKALRDMQSVNENSYISFFELQGGNHFNIIAPVTEIIAKKIYNEKFETGNVSFSIDDFGG